MDNNSSNYNVNSAHKQQEKSHENIRIQLILLFFLLNAGLESYSFSVSSFK